MTPEQLAVDRAICDAAAPGEWRYEDFGGPDCPTVLGADGHTIVCGLHGGEACLDTVGNARFIAAARTRWPTALDEIERLRVENARLKQDREAFLARWMANE
jgi:hypothetical protein